MQRILFRFEKQAPVRFLSHLDLLRAFERAIRRAGIPVAFSEGFNPRPKLVFASALALGATSEAEMATLELAEPLGPDALVEELNKQLPEGLRLLEAGEIPAQGKSPMVALEIAEYELRCAAEPSATTMDSLREAIDGFLGREHCEVLRETPGKGRRKIDIRAKVLSIEPLRAAEGEIAFRLRVAIGKEGSVKPAELVTVLGEQLPGLRLVQMHRTNLLPAA